MPDDRSPVERIMDLEDLVRWLMLAYRVTSYDADGGEHVTYNPPMFPHGDFWGRPMPEAGRMRQALAEVMGE